MPIASKVAPYPPSVYKSATVKPKAGTNAPSAYKPASVVVPQVTNIQDCVRTYAVPNEKLFYIALSAINSSNYKIVEIQSSTATVLFNVSSKEFLLSVSRKDANNSFVRITPADNNYNFPNTIVKRIYSYMDLNNSANIQKLI